MVAQGHGKFGPILVADPRKSFRIIMIIIKIIIPFSTSQFTYFPILFAMLVFFLGTFFHAPFPDSRKISLATKILWRVTKWKTSQELGCLAKPTGCLDVSCSPIHAFKYPMTNKLQSLQQQGVKKITTIPHSTEHEFFVTFREGLLLVSHPSTSELKKRQTKRTKQHWYWGRAVVVLQLDVWSRKRVKYDWNTPSFTTCG